MWHIIFFIRTYYKTSMLFLQQYNAKFYSNRYTRNIYSNELILYFLYILNWWNISFIANYLEFIVKYLSIFIDALQNVCSSFKMNMRE